MAKLLMGKVAPSFGGYKGPSEHPYDMISPSVCLSDLTVSRAILDCVARVVCARSGRTVALGPGADEVERFVYVNLRKNMPQTHPRTVRDYSGK